MTLVSQRGLSAKIFMYSRSNTMWISFPLTKLRAGGGGEIDIVAPQGSPGPAQRHEELRGESPVSTPACVRGFHRPVCFLSRVPPGAWGGLRSAVQCAVPGALGACKPRPFVPVFCCCVNRKLHRVSFISPFVLNLIYSEKSDNPRNGVVWWALESDCPGPLLAQGHRQLRVCEHGPSL